VRIERLIAIDQYESTDIKNCFPRVDHWLDEHTTSTVGQAGVILPGHLTGRVDYEGADHLNFVTEAIEPGGDGGWRGQYGESRVWQGYGDDIWQWDVIIQTIRVEGVEGSVADGAVQVHISGSVGEGIEAPPAVKMEEQLPDLK
jgi:hypothetical protein